jgi:hypothetical protein
MVSPHSTGDAVLLQWYCAATQTSEVRQARYKTETAPLPR